MLNSWQAEMNPYSDNKYYPNAIRLPTREEAEAYACDLALRWTAVHEWRVTPSSDAPNYQWVDFKLVPIKPGDVL